MMSMEENRIVGNFEEVSFWEHPSGIDISDRLKRGLLAPEAGAGIMSRRALPCGEGDKFVVHYDAKVSKLADPTVETKMVVGTLFFDSAHKPLAWGSIEELKGAQGKSALVVGVAPKGAVRAHLYLGGLWAEGKSTAQAVLLYKAASMIKV
jgi:hypothetical protein